MDGYNVYTLENEVFTAFMKYGIFVLLKMVVMSEIVGILRVLKRSFVNVEDAKSVTKKRGDDIKPHMKSNEDVERVSNFKAFN